MEAKAGQPVIAAWEGDSSGGKAHSTGLVRELQEQDDGCTCGECGGMCGCDLGEVRLWEVIVMWRKWEYSSWGVCAGAGVCVSACFSSFRGSARVPCAPLSLCD